MSTTKVSETNTAPVAKKEEKKKFAHKFDEPRRNNVIIVRENTRFKTLVILAKNLLRDQFDSIELHGVDDQSYLTVSLVAQCLQKYKYVEMTRLKTKTVQANYSKENDSKVVLQPRLVIHLKKSKEFDSIFDDFESVFKKASEEHKDEIEKIESTAASATAKEE